ncbi:hypothetical protein LM599_02220 [Candidatus Acetothermia bacterium]|jgi:hypothetical protein|nr:hypothetical protein [Candidatus Acetothermia bacterium]MCI2427675.1 hypothetical protein [Candidatus Acetothermia bacterium]MCI2428376.1 hypothetical protein [Candidatus Acetothermia bacterium]
MRKFLILIGISIAILKLISSLGMAAIFFVIAKWQAVRSFDRTLRRAGLPRSARAELIAQYDIKLRHLIDRTHRFSSRRGEVSD